MKPNELKPYVEQYVNKYGEMPQCICATYKYHDEDEESIVTCFGVGIEDCDVDYPDDYMFFFATIEDVYKNLEGTDGEDFVLMRIAFICNDYGDKMIYIEP